MASVLEYIPAKLKPLVAHSPYGYCDPSNRYACLAFQGPESATNFNLELVAHLCDYLHPVNAIWYLYCCERRQAVLLWNDTLETDLFEFVPEVLCIGPVSLPTAFQSLFGNYCK